nr:hypothetical protein CFP56_46948 [Quercus suber]
MELILDWFTIKSSDDGTCRIWDARYSNLQPRVYIPKPSDILNGKSNGLSSNRPSSSNGPQSHQILCCAYNANRTAFVTVSSDTFARVWSDFKCTQEDLDQPVPELDLLSGHENDVNYVLRIVQSIFHSCFEEVFKLFRLKFGNYKVCQIAKLYLCHSCFEEVFKLFRLKFGNYKAMGRAATSLSKLADTAREELPRSMSTIRLSGMEISDLTLELSDLSQEKADGVSKSTQAVQAAEARIQQIGAVACQQTICDKDLHEYVSGGVQRIE